MHPAGQIGLQKVKGWIRWGAPFGTREFFFHPKKGGWLLEWMNLKWQHCASPKKVTVSLSVVVLFLFSSANIPLLILQCVFSSADNQIAANHCSSSRESPFTMDSRISPWFQPAFFGPTPHPTPTFRFPVICNSEPGGGKPTISPWYLAK